MWTVVPQDGGLRVRFGRQRSVVGIPKTRCRRLFRSEEDLVLVVILEKLWKNLAFPSYHFDDNVEPEVFPPTNWHPKKIDATSGPSHLFAVLDCEFTMCAQALEFTARS